MRIPAISHEEFIEIFWFCDHSGRSRKEKKAWERRLAILSKMHEYFFGVPMSKCKIGGDDRRKPWRGSTGFSDEDHARLLDLASGFSAGDDVSQAEINDLL